MSDQHPDYTTTYATHPSQEDTMNNPTTARGWSVQSDAAAMTPLSHITGRVLSGDVHTILDYLCRRYARLVEPIARGESWGWSYRPVRGTEDWAKPVWSEHAAGTAIDLNAPRHPLGKSGTFTAAQVAGIRELLAELGGVVVWGGDWKSRPDEMHFEVRHDPAEIKRIAGLIRAQYAAEEKATKPAATPAARRVKVKAANIRTGPGTNHSTVGKPIPQGTPWYPTGATDRGWVQGRTPWLRDNNRPAAWIAGDLLEAGQ